MGNHWEALIDLRTAEDGRSDLVLLAQIREAGSGFRVAVSMVYVP